MNYNDIKRLVENKLVNKTETRSYEELSELIFGEGNCFNESEVRKRMYGMKRLIEIIENEKDSKIATRILSISDLHFPFQLDYTLLEKYRNKCDILQINGDVIDCQSLSKFPKQYRISTIEEIIGGREYLINLINYIQPKKVVCNYGNHDKRFANYLSKNLDTDILQLMPDTSLELIFEDGFKNYDKRFGTKICYEPLKNVIDNNIKLEYVDDCKVKIGKTWFIHPLAYRQGILATANKAKDYLQDFDRETFDCVVMAHTHSVGDGMMGNIRLLEQGAFCDVNKLNYMDGKLTKPSKEGFAIICQDEDGNLIQDETKITILN